MIKKEYLHLFYPIKSLAARMLSLQECLNKTIWVKASITLNPICTTKIDMILIPLSKSVFLDVCIEMLHFLENCQENDSRVLTTEKTNHEVSLVTSLTTLYLVALQNKINNRIFQMVRPRLYVKTDSMHNNCM